LTAKTNGLTSKTKLTAINTKEKALQEKAKVKA